MFEHCRFEQAERFSVSLTCTRGHATHTLMLSRFSAFLHVNAEDKCSCNAVLFFFLLCSENQ